ncbi:helix-turn-helix transcriptional regulator [Enterococcus thailandicus]|uniref:helix-turn-helix domain-containing protein n=1 Tax=Enterococcus thailandicus TaxID=417368 RepID=UPI0022EC0FB3|nr:helix-turn-helix transcriptional regulator [Enterococcus thailandicus]MDA3974614.1 helix-turn-helix transcriptional regulator [Enterococcus thailandicus]MDA3977100.1 helix-turn-helix transcriptional regulator [Enterococcus thailandicus]MDA3982118.1 helix-turn-helix transcriptional regulator [Enterococcus thailandicus]
MSMEYFGDKLKSLRKTKKMTQATLADKLGVSKWAVTSYEQGKTYPSIEILIKICDVLEVSSDYLLGISDHLPVKMETAGLSEEEVRLLLQFLNLVEQNRTPKKEQF